MALVASPPKSPTLFSSQDENYLAPESHRFPNIDHIAESDSIVVSPYTEVAHQLRLHTVDPQSQLLAKALMQMKVLRPDYAISPYIDNFNWDYIIENLKELAETSGISWRRQKFFVVVFRSKIPPTTNYGDLGALDKAAHAEATASGGFLKYWFGEPDAEGRNLATCVWCSKEDARLGGVGPAHREAAGAARHLYTEWKIERIALVVEDDFEEWSLTPWKDSE